MNKTIIKKYIDIIMFVTLCFLIGTGLLIEYRLIPGYRGGHGLTLVGLGRHDGGGAITFGQHIYL